ncbi:hypothetical protein BRM3_04100 [Brachybacterium huguangmaarense]|uniref:Uncharacterized protein n=1 Tax=Brachybacterium huguangmaarense TaxID=1652028 RepID=A0ABY6G330_9MICO|nr:hypothetical protein [Brachybacterium huguangmaarense]UYG17620.1 hypothetical protein BRM3_04100 [Brachybacterium huguangmaarense]
MPRFHAGGGSGVAVVRVHAGVEDHRDGFGGLDGDRFVVVDDDLGEQCPVEHASFGGFGCGVEVSEVGEDAQDRVESVSGSVVEGVELVEPAGDCGEAGADAFLFGLEQVEADRVGVVGLEEFELLSFELVLLDGQGLPFVTG